MLARAKNSCLYGFWRVGRISVETVCRLVLFWKALAISKIGRNWVEIAQTLKSTVAVRSDKSRLKKLGILKLGVY